MIVLDLQQGSAEWVKARLGIPTASQFGRIITATGKMSGQAEGYMHELLAESLLGEPADSFSSGFMVRGSDQEQEAIRLYEFQREVDVERVGFCLLDNRRAGCSPDGLVGPDGGIEIKCPAAKTHVGYLLGSPDKDYKTQVQGNLWITERKWWDIFSFNPFMAPAIVRCYRDEDFIKSIAFWLDEFMDKLDVAREKLIEMGAVPVDSDFPFED